MKLLLIALFACIGYTSMGQQCPVVDCARSFYSPIDSTTLNFKGSTPVTWWQTVGPAKAVIVNQIAASTPVYGLSVPGLYVFMAWSGSKGLLDSITILSPLPPTPIPIPGVLLWHSQTIIDTLHYSKGVDSILITRKRYQ